MGVFIAMFSFQGFTVVVVACLEEQQVKVHFAAAAASRLSS